MVEKRRKKDTLGGVYHGNTSAPPHAPVKTHYPNGNIEEEIYKWKLLISSANKINHFRFLESSRSPALEQFWRSFLADLEIFFTAKHGCRIGRSQIELRIGPSDPRGNPDPTPKITWDLFGWIWSGAESADLGLIPVGSVDPSRISLRSGAAAAPATDFWFRSDPDSTLIGIDYGQYRSLTNPDPNAEFLVCKSHWTSLTHEPAIGLGPEGMWTSWSQGESVSTHSFSIV